MTNPIRTLSAVLRSWLISERELEARRQAEEKWRLSEERLRLATEAGKVGLWDWDVTANRVTWTGAMYAIHGVRPGEFGGTGEDLAAMTHPDDRERIRNGLRAALREGQNFEAEFRALRPSGGVIWIYVSAHIVRKNGRAVRLTGATVDIDARKRVELALRESEERFAKAFNASPLSLALYSLRTGMLVEVNETFCNVFGYSREEALGRPALDLGVWRSAQDRESGLKAAREAESVRNLTCRLRTRSGEDRIGLLSAERVEIGGEPHTLVVIEDITERAQVQRALRESESRLRLTLRSANAGVWESNTVTGETFWSEEFRALYGYDASIEPSPARWGERLHPDDRDRVTADFTEKLKPEANEFQDEFRIIHPTLGVRWIHTSGHIERDSSGRVTKMRGISIDISRIKQAEDELRQADQRKNEFLAMLAHELRNPLAPIRNGLEILRLQHTGDVAERARSMMARQLQQMVHLIDDLLEVSRITQGKIQLNRRAIDLKAALQSALEMSKPLIDGAGHVLTIDIPPGPLIVNGDPIRLAQVFGNLLNNAAKYTNPSGHIWLSARGSGDQVSVTVRDNGIGIATAMLPRIFEMFAQVHDPSHHSQGGLGIGLNIAKRLIEMHNGTLEAHSEGPGAGTELTVRLPLRSVPQDGVRATSPHEDAAASNRALRILVADDNTDAALSLGTILKMNGHDVRTAYDGEEALRVAAAFHPHVALLDIGMPLVDGYELCRRLRALPQGGQMFIAAVTGWGQAEDRQRSQEAGFDQHLVKPADFRTLEQLLSEVERRTALGIS